MNQFSLLGKRRFLPFFTTQFLGAFNDNLFKNAILILVTFKGIDLLGMSTNTVNNLGAMLFILPFFLFSSHAGQLADRFEKSKIMRIVKFIEILIMLTAATALLTQSWAWLLVLLFLMGTQSAYFGPNKYGILPQHLATKELIGGNAMVEAGTFLAIILGFMAAGILLESSSLVALTHDPDIGTKLIALAVVLVAAIGFISSLFIPVAPSVAPNLNINRNPFSASIQILKDTGETKSVLLAVLAISWFWLFGSLYMTQLPAVTKDFLRGDGTVFTLVLALFAVGIALGSLLCERLSRGNIEIGLVPIGSLGLTLFAIDFHFALAAFEPNVVMSVGQFLQSDGALRIMFDILMLGISGGIYTVPLYAFIQHRAAAEKRSRVIAGNNIINAGFMAGGAIFAIVLFKFGTTIPNLLLIVGIMNVVVSIYIYSIVPEFFLRLVAWLLSNIMYRVRRRGLYHIPQDGPAVLVCNHVSFVDALIIMGSTSRPIRFVMYYKIFQNPLLGFLFRLGKAIPIAGRKENEDILNTAMASIKTALDDGEIVCIFPEGKLTADGNIDVFKPGVQQIIEVSPVPVIPSSLRGLWGSYFSKEAGAAMRGLPKRFRAKVDFNVGEAILPDQFDMDLLRPKVLALWEVQENQPAKRAQA